jgi:hypothetical protein
MPEISFAASANVLFSRTFDLDAMSVLRAAAEETCSARGQLFSWDIAATDGLVKTLLDRGSDGDGVEAREAIELFATAPAERGFRVRDMWVLRPRAFAGASVRR